MANAVDINNLSFEYEEGAKTIDQISFSVPKGSYTVVLGHNGSGKSTIAKLIIGLLEPKTGDITVDGIHLDEEHLYDVREKVGIVFQNPDNQFIGSTVRDDIAFGLENLCVPTEDMEDIIQTYAKKVNMTEFLDHEPTKLSGGQKQRVAIAGILAMHPSIIILDEATSMLDPRGKIEINNLVHELNQTQNMTILSITHDIEEAALSDHVILLDNGHIIDEGTPEKVLTQKEELERIGLDVPFAYKISKKLHDSGSLKIPQGSFTALIGHTGSGKSTLIQHINALLLPSNGEVDIDEFVIRAGEKPEVLKPLRKKAGLVFQFPEYQLFEETIEKDIIFGPTNFGMSEEEAKERAGKVLKLVGLDESYLERSPFELSGGQKRRVAIAGILAMEPDILVLDEPTAGLDPQGAKEMLELFKKFQESGKTVIMVSHDMNHVLQYCDHVVVMNHGEVERYCDVNELFSERDYLESMSIDLPVITDFIQELNMGGFHINPSIKDIDELVNAIGGEYNG